ncbi:MAG: nucleotidyltransferase family protein [Clostridiales bacterium]|nr:nucleotidyltransferase family protein [Clostridiales bacterium]
MQAILLAGGLGTRLRSVVNDRPKPMAFIEGRPFMEYVVHELANAGITDLIFAVGYRGEMVEDYFGDGSGFAAPDGTSLRVRYAWEKELLGTAGAIRNAGRFITEDAFFVLNADTFYRIDYSRLAQIQREKALDLALVLRRVPDITRYGEATLAEGILTGFNEKTEEARPGTINGGIYYMKRELLDEIPEGKVSLENQMIPQGLTGGKWLGGFVHDGYFIDIGIPEAYYQFIADVKKGVVTW